MLDPRRLLVFDAVLRAGSMSSAALELRYTAAAVSQQIAALEAEAGTPLLKRLARGVAPTAAGAEAGRHARILADQLSAASAAVEAIARGKSGPLRIASFPAASASLLPGGLMRLTSQRPDLSVFVADREADVALSAVRDGTIDLALVADLDPGNPLDTSGLTATELGRATVSVMLPTLHRLSTRDVVNLEDLVRDPWIQSSDAVCAATVARVATGLNVAPRITTHTMDFDSTRGLVAAGLGIALITDLLRAEDGRGVVVRSVHPTPGHPVLAVTPTDASVLPAAAALVATLLEAAPESLASAT